MDQICRREFLSSWKQAVIDLQETSDEGRLKSDRCYGAARNGADVCVNSLRESLDLVCITALARKPAYLQARFRSSKRQYTCILKAGDDNEPANEEKI